MPLGSLGQSGGGIEQGKETGQDVFTVDTMPAKLEAQVRGMGTGFLPTCLAQPYIDTGRLVVKRVERAERVKVQALNEHGELKIFEAEGLLAVCLQHEMDHLMGKVFVEYLSPLKRNRIKTKLLKALRDDE